MHIEPNALTAATIGSEMPPANELTTAEHWDEIWTDDIRLRVG